MGGMYIGRLTLTRFSPATWRNPQSDFSIVLRMRLAISYDGTYTCPAISTVGR
jgi:hypothetical protein